jgi:transcriptional regulator with XRE-family HTH domain
MNLPDYRKKHGVTLAAMAAKVECSIAQLSRIESGKSRASIELAGRIEAATDHEVSVADLRPDLAKALAPRTGEEAA